MASDMTSGRNLLFPRGAVPDDVGARVRAARLSRRWSQERLARAVGVDRRTIVRLELGAHRPTSHLVHALERVLDLLRLVPGWAEPATPDAPSYGPRSRRARRVRGLTMAQAADAAGVSPATLSRYEREMGDTAMIVSPGPFGAIANDAYARALGFADADDMEAYCMSGQPGRWLDRIARDSAGAVGSGPLPAGKRGGVRNPQGVFAAIARTAGSGGGRPGGLRRADSRTSAGNGIGNGDGDGSNA